MSMEENQSARSTSAVQVFEVTMDNPEDQDELNRQLRKPGEPTSSSAAKLGCRVNGEATTESAGKESRTQG
jgi:hypothetical protein